MGRGRGPFKVDADLHSQRKQLFGLEEGCDLGDLLLKIGSRALHPPIPPALRSQAELVDDLNVGLATFRKLNSVIELH